MLVLCYFLRGNLMTLELDASAGRYIPQHGRRSPTGSGEEVKLYARVLSLLYAWMRG